MSTANCTGSLSISNEAALTTVIEFAVAGTSTNGRVAPLDATYPLTADGSGQYVITGSSLLYSNAATSLTGQQTCIANGATSKSTFNINLKTGYNMVNAVYTLTLNSAGKITSGNFSYVNGNRASHWIVNPDSATPLSLNS